MTEQELEIEKKFKELVYDRALEIDPNEEYVWRGVWVGFAIALGLTPERARELSWEVEL